MEGHGVEDLERPSPTPNRPPFGDLGNSRVLGLLDGGRSSSVPKDHKDNHEHDADDNHDTKDDRMTTSKSLGSGLESGDKLLSISNFDLSYPDNALAKTVNGSQQNFLQMEKQNLDKEGNVERGSLDTLVPSSPILSKSPRDEFKANMNRIDSHHSNLEFLAKAQQDNK
ncbi:tudor and KH domain-containing protein homolog [Spodoptera litura]|uniref:Tudor and KH domain-containing protein homolog n=1 Tax=Spodoptera litura TaxID=69820 RepID=A0A9J7E6K2_SPOLT|nr:tudor and KH domain-containing protein homolog [Spodoptera litura]